LLAPEPLGFDEQGREVLRFIEGDTAATVAPGSDSLWSDEMLVDVGRAVAAYHRAVADFVPSEDANWQYRPRALQAGEIICHHDFAPYNAVFRGSQLLGMVDWEGAGPGTIQEEIAFLAWQWVPLTPPRPEVSEAITRQIDHIARLRLLLDSYGYDDRAGLIDAIIERVEISRTGIEARAAEGGLAYVALRDEGHTRDMHSLIRHLETNRRELQTAIE
jgi:aminoglycoside phosphotransferase (APT) family kinase protein